MAEKSIALENNKKKAGTTASNQYLPTVLDLTLPDNIMRENRLNNLDEIGMATVLVPGIMWASLEVTGSGTSNPSRVRSALDNIILPLITKDVEPLVTNEKGQSAERPLLADSYALIAWYFDDKNNTIYVWHTQINADSGQRKTYILTTAAKPAQNTGDQIELTPNFVWPRRAPQ
jgi:hypothetical protein